MAPLVWAVLTVDDAAVAAAACAFAVALTYIVASSRRDVVRLLARVPRHPDTASIGKDRCAVRNATDGGITESSG
jgi:hypothetical protein